MVMKEEFIEKFTVLISEPKYIKDFKNGIVNGEYLEKAYSLMKDFLDKGYGYENMNSDVSEYMLELRRLGEEIKEELILEAITFLVGWCAPEWSLKDYKPKRNRD